MKITFLASSRKDVAWFNDYYLTRFPAGLKNAKRGFARSIDLLRENPMAGRPIPGRKLRMFPILKTPFAIVYLPKHAEIQIARIWDMRSERL